MGLQAGSLFALAIIDHFDSVDANRVREWLLDSIRMFAEVKSLAEQAGDEARVISALLWMAVRYGDVGDLAESEHCAREALERSTVLGNPNSMGWSQFVIAGLLPMEQRMTMLAAASRSFRTAQNLRGVGGALEYMAHASASSGATYSEARRLLEESVANAEALEVSVLRRRLSSLSLYAIYDGDVSEAKRLARRALVLWRREQRSSHEATTVLYVLSLCAIFEGDFPKAAQLWAVWTDAIADLMVDYWKWSAEEAAFRDQSQAVLLEALGPSEMALQQAIGAQLDFGRAVDLALGRFISPHRLRRKVRV